MPETIVEALVDGGSASAGPPLGPALGPLGVNIGKVISEINNKTKDFAGMKVPVKIIVDSATKEFRVEVGSPPVSALIKKELGLEKGSARPKVEKVADMDIDRVIKIARMKKESMLASTDRAAVKEVLGTCYSLGVLVEGKDPREVQKEVDQGIYDDKILGKVELQFWPKEKIEARKKELQSTIKRKEAPKEEEKKEEKKPEEKK
ncbi:MAG: 50S ribosomal protein L11 [Candidatus Diapherotrites archaeon]|nr:50S ribosomal protein L11 [Candidatus Diapherotrites archaeon]